MQLIRLDIYISFKASSYLYILNCVQLSPVSDKSSPVMSSRSDIDPDMDTPVRKKSGKR